MLANPEETSRVNWGKEKIFKVFTHNIKCSRIEREGGREFLGGELYLLGIHMFMNTSYRVGERWGVACFWNEAKRGLFVRNPSFTDDNALRNDTKSLSTLVWILCLSIHSSEENHYFIIHILNSSLELIVLKCLISFYSYF